MSATPRGGSAVSSRERIVQSARAEIEKKGILGLRVQDVAAAADVSVPLIYKYFHDRDGLLAEVLSRMFEEVVLENVAAAEELFDRLSQPSIDDFIGVLALPQEQWRRPGRWLRAQILAASIEIPALRSHLAVVQTHINERIVTFVRDSFLRISGRQLECPEALALLIQSSGMGFVFNDLLDDGQQVRDAQYSELLRDLLKPYFAAERT